MRYENIVEAQFIVRPNRFIAHCEAEGAMVTAHVRNTGRCRELLIPGVTVYLEMSGEAKRKTGYSLVTVMKGEKPVNIDSTAPNKVLKEALSNGCLSLPGLGPLTLIKPETTFCDSRFDFYLEAGDQKAFIEVKGVTLEEEGKVLFPDAPTERGVKHVEEMIRAREEGYEAYLVFIVQMKDVLSFSPNRRTHEAFATALKKAQEAGVRVLCYDCLVEADSIFLRKPVPVIL